LLHLIHERQISTWITGIADVGLGVK